MAATEQVYAYWWEARWHARAFLEPLLIPGEPMGPMATLLTAVGLAAKDAGEHTTATDVVCAAVGQRRLDPHAVGAGIGALYQRVLKASRVATRLASVAAVSPAHADAVIAIAESTLAELSGPPPSDLHALLGLLTDLLTERHTTLTSAAARNYLAALDGGGKGATAARAILSATA